MMVCTYSNSIHREQPLRTSNRRRHHRWCLFPPTDMSTWDQSHHPSVPSQTVVHWVILSTTHTNRHHPKPFHSVIHPSPPPPTTNRHHDHLTNGKTTDTSLLFSDLPLGDDDEEHWTIVIVVVLIVVGGIQWDRTTSRGSTGWDEEKVIGRFSKGSPPFSYDDDDSSSSSSSSSRSNGDRWGRGPSRWVVQG